MNTQRDLKEIHSVRTAIGGQTHTGTQQVFLHQPIVNRQLRRAVKHKRGASVLK